MRHWVSLVNSCIRWQSIHTYSLESYFILISFKTYIRWRWWVWFSWINSIFANVGHYSLFFTIRMVMQWLYMLNVGIFDFSKDLFRPLRRICKFSYRHLRLFWCLTYIKGLYRASWVVENMGCTINCINIRISRGMSYKTWNYILLVLKTDCSSIHQLWRSIRLIHILVWVWLKIFNMSCNYVCIFSLRI